MKWRKATFKEKAVWAAVTGAGELAAEGGRVPIRYSSREGAKIYRAGASGVALVEGAPAEDLDEGVSADAARGSARSGSRAGGRGRGFGKAGTRSAGQAAAAKAQARQLLADLPEGTVIAFTDGACHGNPGPAGSGAVVQLSEDRTVEACRSLGRATNNVAELTAIGLVLDILDEAEVPADTAVAILSDSDYANGVLTQGWKAKANRELITELRSRLGDRPGVTVHWVAGHAGVDGNERADALATMGAEGQTFRSD
ncbi:MAG: reverse transcriptase-like protein [Myxococcales bacterium]|nr:reverse transcriptase-like protein [Myxococcales bacterium]